MLGFHLGLAFDEQEGDGAVLQSQPPDGVGQALPQPGVDQVGAGVLDGYDLSRIDTGQGNGVQQVAHKDQVEHEALEGGVVREAHLDEGHGRSQRQGVGGLGAVGQGRCIAGL